MRALTVKQPWAAHIFDVHYGPKNVENRTWRTNYRGPLLIHAASVKASRDSLAPDPSPWAQAQPITATSAIVGLVDLVDVIEDEGGPWAMPFHWHWVLENPRPFAEPVKCPGALQVWNTAGRLTGEQHKALALQLVKIGWALS